MLTCQNRNSLPERLMAIGFPKLIIYKKSDRYKVMEFCYYKICDVVATCLVLIVQYRRRPNITG